MTIDSTRRERPLLLTIGMFGSALYAIVWLTLLVLAPFDLGAYHWGGQTFTGPEFLRAAGLPLGVAALICAAISIGLARERPWTRTLMIFFWAIIDAFLVAEVVKHHPMDVGVPGAVIFAAAYMAAAAWYLYFKPNVVEYYRALESAQAARRHTPDA
jgi:hypothetical protein